MSKFTPGDCYKDTKNYRELLRISRLWSRYTRGSLEELTVPRVLEILSTWDISNSTKNRRLSVLRVLFKQAGLPVPPFPVYPEPRPTDRSIPDLPRLLKELTCPGIVRDALEILAGTGCRLGELCRHTRQDISQEGWLIRDTKNGDSRLVPLLPRVRTLLLQRDYGNPGGTKNTRLYRRIQHHWSKTGYRVHDIRHTFASQMVRAGTSLYIVQKILGHRSFQTTQRYAHLDTKALEEAIRRTFAES